MTQFDPRKLAAGTGKDGNQDQDFQNRADRMNAVDGSYAGVELDQLTPDEQAALERIQKGSALDNGQKNDQ